MPPKAATQSKGAHLGGNVVQCGAVEQDPKGDNDSIAVAGAGTRHQGHWAGATAILQVGGVLPTHAAQLRTLYMPKCGLQNLLLIFKHEHKAAIDFKLCGGHDELCLNVGKHTMAS